MESHLNEISSTDDKYGILHNKYTQLLADYTELSQQKLISSHSNLPLAFQTILHPEKIQTLEQMRESYLILLEIFEKVIEEKQEILDMLRSERVCVEEQRNYIEILRQTLESDLIKSGILNKYVTITNALDFNKIRLECEKYRKDLVLSHALISSLQSEFEELTVKCNKLQDETKENSGLENKNQNISNKRKKVCGMPDDQNEFINTRLNEYKDSYEKLNQKFEILLKEKTAIESENARMKEEQKINQDKYYLLENEFKKRKSMDGEKNSETLSFNQRNRIQRITLPFDGNDLTYRKLYEEISLEFEEYKKSQRKLIKEFKLPSQLSSDDIFEKQNENVSIDKLQIEKNQNKFLILENNKLRVENEKFKKEFSFLKDKQEQDTLIKSNEIKNLNEEISKMQCQTLENCRCNEKFEEIFLQYKQIKEKFELKEQELGAVSRKYEKLLQAFQDYGAKIEANNQIIKDLKNEKYALTDKNEKMIMENSEIKNLLEQAQKKINEKELMNEKEKNLNTLHNNEKSENEDTYKHRSRLKEDYISISEIKSYLYPLHENMGVLIHKFDRYANDDLNSLLTNNFSQNITKLLLRLNTMKNENEDVCIVQLTVDFLQFVTSEFENVYEKLFDSNLFVRDSNEKVSEMGRKLKETEAELQKLNEREYKLKCLLKVTTDEKSQVNEEIIELQNEISLIKQERDEAYKELKQYKTEYYSIANRNVQLGKENSELVKEVQAHLNSFSKLEKKILIMSKEKKSTDSIFQNFIKTFPNKDICKLMCDYFSINDQISKMEMEKFNIEEKLNIMEKEDKILSEDQSSLNMDLSNIVKREEMNMKRLMNEYEKKISEKKETLRKLEQEIYSIEAAVKRTYELSLENERNYQRVEKELSDIKKGKSAMMYACNEIPMVNENKNKLEITSFDMNTLLFSSTSKPEDKDQDTIEQNNSSSKAKLLTEYGELELDYSPHEISNEKKKTSATWGKSKSSHKNSLRIKDTESNQISGSSKGVLSINNSHFIFQKK